MGTFANLLLLLTLYVLQPASAISLGQWQEIDHNGESVSVYAPEESTNELMIVLHGCNQSADDFVDRAALDKVAETYGVVIAVPNVPGGGVLLGCWDYYDEQHTREETHVSHLLTLPARLESLIGNSFTKRSLTGLSSGAAMVNLVTCLAPDAFDAIGVVSGAALGTTAFDVFRPRTNSEEVTKLCRELGIHPAARYRCDRPAGELRWNGERVLAA